MRNQRHTLAHCSGGASNPQSPRTALVRKARAPPSYDFEPRLQFSLIRQILSLLMDGITKHFWSPLFSSLPPLPQFKVEVWTVMLTVCLDTFVLSGPGRTDDKSTLQLGGGA
jgi:hypothetical protein